jgi:hypothetical protein
MPATKGRLIRCTVLGSGNSKISFHGASPKLGAAKVRQTKLE